MRALFVFAASLCLAACSSQTAMERDASDAAKARFGKAPSEAKEVEGLRENAVCGSVDGDRFVYRQTGLFTSSEIAEPQFSAFYRAWCG